MNFETKQILSNEAIQIIITKASVNKHVAQSLGKSSENYQTIM